MPTKPAFVSRHTHNQGQERGEWIEGYYYRARESEGLPPLETDRATD